MRFCSVASTCPKAPFFSLGTFVNTLIGLISERERGHSIRLKCAIKRNKSPDENQNWSGPLRKNWNKSTQINPKSRLQNPFTAPSSGLDDLCTDHLLHIVLSACSHGLSINCSLERIYCSKQSEVHLGRPPLKSLTAML